ncbi:hypothetical protein GIB67_041551 [Kingdonia uniflora]|uniref:Protein EARLY FLOWERING 4 domain-containing protein n=1 Tax=Kingdonia uniflora TaxID=39325 RepID=A0A7J7MQK9_9MAGN|nr:hypothetical protein GIB67_041551 [Kingdonia uniflora]
MEGEAFSGLGNGTQVDTKVLQTSQKVFLQVQHILDQNRLLINEINQNHQSKIPDNLSRNVGLIRELNNNIRRIVDIYADFSTSFSKTMEGSSEGDSGGKSGQKRVRPGLILDGPGGIHIDDVPSLLDLVLGLSLPNGEKRARGSFEDGAELFCVVQSDRKDAIILLGPSQGVFRRADAERDMDDQTSNIQVE